MNNEMPTRHVRPTAVARPFGSIGLGVALLALVVGACASEDGDSRAAAAATVPTPTAPPSSAAATTVATTAAATDSDIDGTTPSTAAVATSPPTTESCGAFCPLTDEQQSATDSFFAAYNGGDWAAFLGVLATDQPTWVMTVDQTQSTELMRNDFIWSASMNETWVPERCVDQYGIVSCSVIMEDDLHRLLAPHGMEPSICQVSFDVVGGNALPKRYDALTGCHGIYDGAMHYYGAWYEQENPGESPIQGPHYRAWNQTDETAGDRASEHLAEWGQVVDAAFADGGDIFDVTGHP